MASWNKATTSKDLPLQAVRDLLESMDEDRAELVRERDNAIRSGNLDLVLQSSKDLRLLHRDYLQGTLKAVLIRHSQTPQRAQHSGAEWPQWCDFHEFGWHLGNVG